MSNSTSIKVFVSYSTVDRSLVIPVVRLLRANRSFVFQDIDSIQPGKRWRHEIEKALTESDLVIVFWCDHANRSNEVYSEWKSAIAQGKDILPLLLDGAPLPLELREFEWIDFQEVIGANHDLIGRVGRADYKLRNFPAADYPTINSALLPKEFIYFILFVIFTILYYYVNSVLPFIIIIFFVLAGLFIFWAWRLGIAIFKKWRSDALSDEIEKSNIRLQEFMAWELKTEIFRRVTMKRHGDAKVN